MIRKEGIGARGNKAWMDGMDGRTNYEKIPTC